MDINSLIAAAHGTAKEKGFWDKERNTGELLMLIVSELSEALEADRKSRHCTLNSAELELGIILAKKMQEKDYKNTFVDYYNDNIKGTFEEEVADTFIRLFDLVGGKNIDITTHILLKMSYNKTREKLHGKKY